MEAKIIISNLIKILKPTNLGITIFFLFFFVMVFLTLKSEEIDSRFVALFRGRNVGAIIFSL
jgi:hypothetical protein